MKSKKISAAFKILLAVVLCLGAYSASFAEPPRGGDRPPMMNGGGDDGDMPMMDESKIKEIKEKVRKERNERIREELKFDEAKTKKLIAVLDKLDDERASEMKEGFGLFREIKDATKDDNLSEAKAKELLDKLEKKGNYMCESRKKKHEEIKKILTAKEMLKYLAFERKFEQGMRDVMREKMRGGDNGVRDHGKGEGRDGAGKGGERRDRDRDREHN